MVTLAKPNPSANRQAREQATAYGGLFASHQLELDGGDIIEIPPHPNLRMLDDDRQEQYEELLFEIESYDRGPDIYMPEQTLPSGVVLPAETKPGPLLEPYRKDGKLVKPPYSVRVVQVALGEETYRKLRAGGRCAADVWRIWNTTGMEITERSDFRPATNGSSSGLAAVPAPDRG